MSLHEMIHSNLLSNLEKAKEWFQAERCGCNYPFYMSADIRDSGYKVASVDANAFPAGFNNICDVDLDAAPELIRSYLSSCYGTLAKVLLVTEEHTQNAYYWDNVIALADIIRRSGVAVRIGVPSQLEGLPKEIVAASGNKVLVEYAQRSNGGIRLDDGFVPDLIISNNDFSQSYNHWAQGLSTSITPPRELGWYQRRKSDHFDYYNSLANEFSKIVDLDPWVFTIETQLVEDFQLEDEGSKNMLADRVETMISSMKVAFKEHQVQEEPVVFVKNNAGTYGLAVTQVRGGDDIMAWNYKTRKKMKAAKGGRNVNELILQEGIPTVVKSENFTAEPVVYMVGCEPIGGFLRTHAKKDARQSLNSPGAVYRRMCMADLKVDVGGSPLENVYSWVARLSALAVGREITKVSQSPD